MDKEIVGLIERVKIIGEESFEAMAKFDTGAARTCIDKKIAEKIKLGPVVKFVKVKSATLKEKKHVRRPVYKAKLEIHGKIIPVELSVADRKNLKYDVLIGRDAINSNFLIDVSKKNKKSKESD